MSNAYYRCQRRQRIIAATAAAKSSLLLKSACADDPSRADALATFIYFLVARNHGFALRHSLSA